MADKGFYSRLERCTNEIPLNSSADCQNATVCNAPADVETEAGFRCHSCFQQYGGELVSEITRHAPDPLYYRPESRPPMRAFDFGTAMLCALDRLEKEGIL